MSTEEPQPWEETFLYQILEALKTRDEMPSPISRLFTGVHYALTWYYCCQQIEPNLDTPLWPCPAEYKSEVIGYYHQDYSEQPYWKKFDVSILDEKNEGASKEFFFIVFSFPEVPHAYRVRRISKNCAIRLNRRGEVENMGDASDIHVHVVLLFSKIVLKFYENPEECPRLDFCDEGIAPSFECLEEKTNETRKRKRPTSPVAEHKQSKFYTLLFNLHSQLESSSPSARLMGCILKRFDRAFRCTGTYNKEGWPCEAQYDGSVYQLWFQLKVSSFMHGAEKSLTKEYRIFNASLLKNSKEYFFHLSTVDNKKFIVHKVSNLLVPTFKEEERELDYERLDKIAAWMRCIFVKFIQNVETFSMHSPSSSRSSSPSTHSSENDEFSSDESTTD